MYTFFLNLGSELECTIDRDPNRSMFFKETSTQLVYNLFTIVKKLWQGRGTRYIYFLCESDNLVKLFTVLRLKA